MAVSKDLVMAFSLISVFVILDAFGESIAENCMAVMNHFFSLTGEIDDIFTNEYMTEMTIFLGTRMLIMLAPIFIVTLLVGFLLNLWQVKWKITTKPMMPKFDKFNPVSGFKRIFSMNAIAELIKSLAKVSIIFMVIYSSLKDEVNQIQTLLLMGLPSGIIYIGNLCTSLGLKLGIFFVLIGVADYAYQKYSHTKKLKMTKQEVKDEAKQTEGNPEIKSKIRSKMMESSMRRMMQSVPQADVIITNPTHYAVAIKYEIGSKGAPIVVAKGVDHLARRIKKVAAENNVEIVENRPLARALYNTVDVGREIPPELYQAVADVLAFVYKLRHII